MVPAFEWHEERGSGAVTRHRLGGRLRVELARPWFTTGEGEALAVVLWPEDEAALPVELREQVSWLNRDPIHSTDPVPALAAETMFTGFRTGVDVPLSEGGPTVRALAYPVFFDGGHWYADIELPGAVVSSYSPFVRLAVARFQADSLFAPQDVRMSTVVTADLAPALPTRQLIVTRTDAGLNITLSGVARRSEHQANRVFASLERLAPGTPPDRPTSCRWLQRTRASLPGPASPAPR